jgi:DNA polymerase III alpha subunit
MSSISIDDIIRRACDLKQKYVALIDINNLYGAMEFYQKATANHLSPIIGLQVNYQHESVVLIAKNNHGYHNLIKISSRVMTNTAYDLNDFIDHTYVVVQDRSKSKWLKHHHDVYSSNLHADAPIAIQECFFENKEDVKYLQALMAIAHNQPLATFQQQHEHDEKYMLNENEAQQRFSTPALQNLEHVITSCT